MTRPRLEFWFDFASTYSYLSAMRIEALASARSVDVAWRPFLLGPIFQAQGWTTSPFNHYPAKGRYMVRDMQRLCQSRGLVFHMPDRFPANGLKAARIALAGAAEPWIGAFVGNVYRAQFSQGEDIADDDMLLRCLDGLGVDSQVILRIAQGDENKLALRRQTEAAAAAGIFGAPSFVTPDGELFWGDDRLEDALSWIAA